MVIEEYYKYESFTKDIMRQFPLIRTEQLDLMLSNYFDEELLDLKDIKWALQSVNTVILSSDGWAMTPAMYKALTGIPEIPPAWSYTAKKKVKAPGMENYIYNYDLLGVVNCLWLVADMLPFAVHSTHAQHPFDISFITEPETTDKVTIPSVLYELVYIPKNAHSLLMQLANVKDNKAFPEYRNTVKRIALVEDENDAVLVPHNGFTRICKINHTLPSHFEVIETRTGTTVWLDE